MSRIGKGIGRGSALLSLMAMIFGFLMTAPGARADGAMALASAAEDRANHKVLYDPAYVSIDYPGGDVAPDRGVCTDVVIRAYRAVGIDLQKEVHEDMTRAFGKYPQKWGLKRPDSNIDHRRVPNLETFLARKGAELPASEKASDYQPGDVVTWRLADGRPHMGIVTSRKSASGVPMIAHNIGAGPRVEDMLFDLRIHRHFRWHPRG